MKYLWPWLSSYILFSAKGYFFNGKITFWLKLRLQFLISTEHCPFMLNKEKV